MVEIKFYGELYELTRIKEYKLKVATGNLTLLDLIKLLDGELHLNVSRVILDEKGMIRERYIVLINGSAVKSRDPASVKIRDEDVIVFLPPAVGGKLYCSAIC
ncbi:MAG: MoaD/ThiS family protein [Desulfurococcaceae archaeon]